MATNNVKRFEFRLGKWGLGLFVTGMSLLVFVAFLFGVKVGKDMDAYPEKYSWGIPEKIGETLGSSGTPKSDKTVVAVREAGKANSASEKAEYDLSFYDTLSKRSDSLKKPPSENGITEKVPVAPVAPSGEKVTVAPAPPPSVPAAGHLQASKPAGGKKEVRGVPSSVAKVEPAPQGKSEEKTVAKAIPEKVREVKTPAVEKKAEQKPEKALPVEKKRAETIEKIIAADRKVDKNKDKKEVRPEDKVNKPVGQTFMIQVGSYRDKGKAEQVAAKLKTMGYTPRIVLMDLKEKGKWYRLTISGFPNHNKAAEAVANVAKSTGSKGFIRPEGE